MANDIAELVTRLRADGDVTSLPMLTFYEGSELRTRYNYSEFLDQVARRAGWLSAMGITRGDRVALLSPNCPEVPLYTIALMRLGAASVPLNPGSHVQEWHYILEHAGVRGLLGTSALLARACEAGPALEFARDIADLPDNIHEPPAVAGLADDIATILYTSGTTARPKGVAMTHRSILMNVRAMASNFGLHRTTQLSVLPLYHAHAFNFGLMTALVTEGHFVFTDHFEPFTWAQLINAENVTVTSAFPSLLPLMIRAGIRSSDVPRLRHMMVTSAPLPSRVASAFEDEVGIPLMHGWGLSETTCLATCMPPEQDAETHRRLLRDYEVPCMGTPLNGIDVAVLDAQGARLPPLTKGELCVRGETVMKGYFRDPAATAAAVQEGWLHSGDEGFYVMEDGKPFFFITGRIKEIIIRGAENYSPLALEETLLITQPSLRGRFVLLGFEHDLFGEEIGAYVEGACEAHAVRVFESALDAMPPGLRPKVIVWGAEPVPRTHTGKVQRRKLLHHFTPYRSYVGAPKHVQASAGVGSTTG